MLSNGKRLFLSILLVFSIASAIVVAFYLIDLGGKSGQNDEIPNVDLAEELNAIYINDELYLPKNGVENYLIIGVDKAGETDSDQMGQADFLMVLSFDSNDMTYTMLSINRDTIARVEEVDIFGNRRVVEKQIALSHAYESSQGLTNREKCESTAKAASSILCGMRFHGYMSMTMDAVKLLVDGIGGVDLVIEEDNTDIDPEYIPGATVTLNGERAMSFVRMRGGLNDSTNIARMRRQETFLKAFFEGIGNSELSDEEIFDLYEGADGYMYHSMGDDGYVELFHKLSSYERKNTVTLKGESRVGAGGYMEFYVDKSHVEEVMVDVFYKKAE